MAEENNKTNEFDEYLTVGFFDGKNLIAPKEEDYPKDSLGNSMYKYCKIPENGRMTLHIEKQKTYIDILMKTDKITIHNTCYDIINRDFFLDANTLYIEMKKSDE